jgi:transketolase C-terminal domain/subunit
MELVAVHDRFGRSGKQDELMAEFGIKSPDIVKAAERALARKRPRS